MPPNGESGAPSNTKVPQSPQELIDWLNANIAEAEKKLAQGYAQGSTTEKFRSLAVKARAQLLPKSPICGIEHTKDGFILYCSSPQTARFLGAHYFHTMPLEDEGSFLSETERALQESLDRAAGIHQRTQKKHPYTEKNMIRVEDGLPAALRHIWSAIHIMQSPVGKGVVKTIPWDDANPQGLVAWGEENNIDSSTIGSLLKHYNTGPEKPKEKRPETIVVDEWETSPCIFPEIPFEPLPEVAHPYRRKSDVHPARTRLEKSESPPKERRRASDMETQPPTFAQRLAQHPLTRALPKEGELAGTRAPAHTSLLERLRGKPQNPTTGAEVT